MNKERQSNFELLRIVSIFLIITGHIIVHGRIFSNLPDPYPLISNIIMAIVIVHVNSLVFVTGYFNGDKKDIGLKKVFKLIGTSWFYKSLIVLIFLIWGITEISNKTILEELLPLDVNNYWFLNCYLILYILSPYLNKIIDKMEKKEFSRFIIIQIILLSIIPIITDSRFIQNTGYSIINFILIYYLGAYFKRYPLRESKLFKNISKIKLRFVFIILFFVLASINIGLYYLGDVIIKSNNELLLSIGTAFRNSFLFYSNPIIILQSCVYCFFFESLNIKSKFINWLASYTFVVYIIHDNALIRSKVYEWLDVTRYGASKRALIVLIVSALIIYICCIVIETIRRMIFKVFKNKEET